MTSKYGSFSQIFLSIAIKRGGGGKALVAGPLKKTVFLRLPQAILRKGGGVIIT